MCSHVNSPSFILEIFVLKVHLSITYAIQVLPFVLILLYSDVF